MWAAPYWWVPHGPAVRFAGRGWLLPVGNAYVLLFIVLLLGAAVRVVRTRQGHPLRVRVRSRLGRRAMAPTGAGS
jgi:hypothetical protein